MNSADVNVSGSAMTTSTIAGRIRMRADGGYPGITFNVGNGTAATDLLVYTAAITTFSPAGLGIIKTGAGRMDLTGANTYTGGTTINANGGTLNFNMAAWEAEHTRYAISVGSNSTLGLNVTSGLNYTGNISGAGTIQNNGGNWAYFNGAAAGQFSGFTGTFLESGGNSRFESGGNVP